ncbi:TPA: trypsin-like serine peptidase [Klebsiella variicola]
MRRDNVFILFILLTLMIQNGNAQQQRVDIGLALRIGLEAGNNEQHDIDGLLLNEQRGYDPNRAWLKSLRGDDDDRAGIDVNSRIKMKDFIILNKNGNGNGDPDTLLITKDPCPTCVFVNSIPALRHVTIESSKEVLPKSVVILANAVSQTKEGAKKLTPEMKESLDKYEVCSQAVSELRKQRPLNNSNTTGNLIEEFDDLCSPTSKNGGLISNICMSTYNSYVKNCISDTDNVSDKRIVGRIGIFFSEQGLYKGQPTCTGTVIDSTHIATARHCFIRKEGDPDLRTLYGDEEGNKYLTFTPSLSLLDLNESESQKYNGELIGELTSDGVKKIKLEDRQPLLSEDFIIVVLKNPLKLETPELQIKIATTKSYPMQLTLIGYQDAVTRRDKMYSRQFYLGGEVSRRYYLSNIMMDNTPLCFEGPEDSGGFYHYCQSMSRMSGAPLFEGNLETAKDKNDSATIAGVLSGGNGTSDIDVESQGAPNKAAMIDISVLDALRQSNIKISTISK